MIWLKAPQQSEARPTFSEWLNIAQPGESFVYFIGAGLGGASMASQPKGLGKKANLADWKAYSDANSVNYRPIKAQSKRDLSIDDGPKHEWSKDNWRVPQKQEEGKGWVHYSEVSKTNSYTGKGGSRRD